MNINFGIISALGYKVKGKRNKNAAISERSLAIIDELKAIAAKDKRVPVPLSKLKIGLKCGGSDGYSGITANPVVGRAMNEFDLYGRQTCFYGRYCGAYGSTRNVRCGASSHGTLCK